MTTTPFKHSPLDPADPRAIQILELLPSRNLKGPICCELHQHSLDKDIRYEAVSYTWGDPEPGHTVFVNGSHTLDVTPNCLEALTCLRRRLHRRYLWVDAICIDQREDDTSRRERDRQVRIMGDIFNKAQRVLVWLGPAEPTTARTIARLKLIARVEAIRDSVNLGYSALLALEDYLCTRMIEPNSFELALKPRYQAFASIITSPWWQRVWTMQEQALARHCEAYHGRKSISILSLQPSHLVWTINSLTNGGASRKYVARHRVQLFCQTVNSYPLEYSAELFSSLDDYYITAPLLELAFLLDAKYPIDRTYGLYSILRAHCHLPLSVPDYSRTAEDVYEEVVRVWIDTRADLSILKLAARPALVHELPSWVPAWHQQHPSYIRNIGRSIQEVFESRNSHFDWHYSKPMPTGVRTTLEPSGESDGPVPVASLICPGTLRVFQARFAGKVSHVIGPDRSHDHRWYCASPESLYIHVDWCRLVSGLSVHGTTEREEALHEMFRSLLIPGIHQIRLEDGESLDEPFESFLAWFDFMLYLSEESVSPDQLSPGKVDTNCSERSGMNLYFDLCAADEEEEAAKVLETRYTRGGHGTDGLTELARRIQKTTKSLEPLRNHSLCILDNENMLAVTDFWCQEDDEVFVFPGTDSPFVLRRQPDGDCYRLVGPALVDRLLRKGYQEWRSEGDDLQDIVLI